MSKKIYITSDWHLGHKSMITNKWRHFESIEEMNQTILHNAFSLVKKDDHLLFLGDVALGPDKNQMYFTIKLNCNPVFVQGNHDPKSLTRLKHAFIEFNGERIELVHDPNYSLLITRVVLHGHLHKNGTRYMPDGAIKISKRIHLYKEQIFYNVNIELSKYKPRTINEIMGEIEFEYNKFMSRKIVNKGRMQGKTVMKQILDVLIPLQNGKVNIQSGNNNINKQ